jgi:ribonuclease P protein component
MRPTLRNAEQFDAVYTRGRKSTSPVLVLFHLERAADNRVAFVASRKVGGAVQRNRAKRVLRAALAQVEAAAGGAVPGWLVLVARRDILELTSVEVAARLRATLEAAGSEPIARRADALRDDVG